MYSILNLPQYLEKSKINQEKYKEEMQQYNLEQAIDDHTLGDQESSSNLEANSSNEIQIEHLGFAKEKGYPWHPALWSSSFLNGNRVVVIFLGTGQRVIVDKANWICYNDKS